MNPSDLSDDKLSEHKRLYLEECQQPSSLWFSLTSVYIFPIFGRQRGPSTMVTSFLQNIIFCVQWKKEMGLEQL